MPKIIDNGAIKYGASLLAETKEGYFINNNYYDNNLRTYQFQTASIAGNSEQLQTRMNSLLRVPSGVTGNISDKIKQTLGPLTIRDNQDPSIIYSIYSNYSLKKDENVLIKYSESKEDGIKIHQTTTFTGMGIANYSGYSSPYAIFAQTNKYIFIGSTMKTSIYYNYITFVLYRYEKSTGLITVAYKGDEPATSAYPTSLAIPLISNENELFFVLHVSSHTIIMKLDLNTNAAAKILTIDTLSYTERYFDSVKKIDENTVEYIYPQLNKTSTSFMGFKKIELNTSNYVIKQTEIPVTYNELFTQSTLPSNSIFGLMYHSFEYTTTNGNTYYNIAVYTFNHKYDGKEFEGIYTYKKMEDGSLEAKGYTLFSLSNFTTGFLLSKDNSSCIAGSAANVSSYYFDEIQEKYVKKSDFNISNPISMGFDKNDKIWIVDEKFQLHCFSNNTPKNVTLKLDNQFYKFDGDEIQGTVSITCKNYIDTPIKTNLILTINGEAVFTDNGMKNIRVSVTEEQPLVIPITIKNSGDIIVSSKIVQE